MVDIVLLLIALVVVLIILAYSIRLQRRAVVTQDAVVHDHLAEKTQRQRQYLLGEESVELQKRGLAYDEEGRQLLRRSVELQEEILKALRESHK